jgi:hypothetical protein
MTMRWMPAVLIVVALVAAGCDSVDGAATTTSTSGGTTATTVPSATTSSSAASSTTTAGPAETLTVSQVLDTQPTGTVSVSGVFYDGGAGPLLCEALAESYPPQCVGRWLILTAPPTGDLITEGGISWLDQPVVVTGFLDGDVFVLEGRNAPEPTGPDLALIDMLSAFARGQGDLAAVPFADAVQLGLADMLLVTRTPTELTDPASWVLDLEPFRARTGPYSALDLLAEQRPYVVTVGPHNHCASPPVPAPEGYAGYRRVSVHPADATSCLEWFTVDLFLADDGTIEAITLDLYEP